MFDKKEYMKEYSKRPKVVKSIKEYYIKNKEKIKLRTSEYYFKNKNNKEFIIKRKKYRKLPEVRARKNKLEKEYRKLPKTKECKKRWRKNNVNKIKEYSKKWKLKNKEKVNKWSLNFYYRNKEKILKIKKESRLSNPEKYRKRDREYSKTIKYKLKKREYNKKFRPIYEKHRYKNDKEFNLVYKLRRNLKCAFNKYSTTGKIYSSSKYGINYKAIIENLKPFPEDLSNYHIHHIKPLHTFDFNDKKQIKQAFAPENHILLTIEEHKEVHRGLIKFAKC